MRDAQVGQGGVYFLDGVYRVEIIKCTTIQSRKKEDLFIVECKVLESNNDQRKPGVKASWIVNLKHDAALGNIKGFIAAANGISPSLEEEKVNEEVGEEEVEFAVSKDNPLAGIIVDLEAITIQTRAKTPFTLHKWEPAEEA